MYSGTLNISSLKVNSELTWTDEVYSGVINLGNANFTGSFIVGDNPLLEQRISDLETFVPSWDYYALNWSEEPTLIASITEGDVYAYVLNGITRYRFVPTIYTPIEDAFYSDFDGTNLTGLISKRG